MSQSLLRPRLRFVRDETRIRFMRGRHLGLAVSAFLSLLSVALFFYPGLSLGLDFRGGIVVEARTQGPADFGRIRTALAAHGVGNAGLQQFGAADDVLIQVNAPTGTDAGSEAATQARGDRGRAATVAAQPGTQILRADAVGASVSAELFRDGLLALGISLLMILGYIWFRFEWEFAVSAVATLVLFEAVGLHAGLGNVMLAHIVFCIPFALLPMRARLRGLGPELEDAARDLYAGPWRTFRLVTLPLLAPAVVAGATLAFVVSLDDFLITLMVAPAGATTLPVYLYGMLRLGVTPEANAAATLLLLASVIAVVAAQLFGGLLAQNGE